MTGFTPVASSLPQTILIVGATSAMARATATVFAQQQHILLLAARDQAELKRIANDLQIRFGNQNYTFIFDIDNLEQQQDFFEKIFVRFPKIDGVIFAVGYMGEDRQKLLSVNFNSTVFFLEQMANYFIAQRHGWMTVISSVAGDRGRKSNYWYGAAKGGLNIWLEGLRHRLFSYHIRVITVKPGFVDTRMTFGLPGLFAVADPLAVGKVIAQCHQRAQNVVYVPGFWRGILWIIRHLPNWLFHRLSL